MFKLLFNVQACKSHNKFMENQSNFWINKDKFTRAGLEPCGLLHDKNQSTVL